MAGQPALFRGKETDRKTAQKIDPGVIRTRDPLLSIQHQVTLTARFRVCWLDFLLGVSALSCKVSTLPGFSG